MALALNNPQNLICHKTKKPNQSKLILTKDFLVLLQALFYRAWWSGNPNLNLWQAESACTLISNISQYPGSTHVTNHERNIEFQATINKQV